AQVGGERRADLERFTCRGVAAAFGDQVRHEIQIRGGKAEHRADQGRHFGISQGFVGTLDAIEQAGLDIGSPAGLEVPRQLLEDMLVETVSAADTIALVRARASSRWMESYRSTGGLSSRVREKLNCRRSSSRRATNPAFRAP